MVKKIFIVLLGLIGVIGISFYAYIQSHKPTYSGTQELDGLESKAEVFFDDYGIPHIYAESEQDAYMALGYVHAQERLWQMEVVRRIAPGRLSELFGRDLVETDMLFRTLGINEYSKTAVESFKNNKNTKMTSLATAYLDGINQFVANGPTPIEFTILNIEKTPFTVTDMYNTIGYMSFSFAMAHRTDPVVTNIYQNLGPEYVADLGVDVDPTTALLKSYPKTNNDLEISAQISKIIDHLPASPWIGSNSWVIGPEKTKSGKVLLANDPHIAYSQPAVWYEAHLNAPGFELYGYHIAGYPFANIGHNSSVAFGLTMFENDDIDLFREKPNPDNADQYWSIDHWENYIFRDEEIMVKDSSSVKFKVRSTRHGPVINDVIKSVSDDAPISMWWIYTQLPSQLLDATYILCNAQNINEARQAAQLIHAPGLNVMYGDKEGNIAWWAVAKLPIRPDHVNSKLILDGASGKDDPLGFYDFANNPQAENPPWGYVYSANNQPDTINGIYHPGYYVPEDRGRRIEKLLNENDQWDIDDMKAMILDVQSENVPEIIEEIILVLENSGVEMTSQNGNEALESLRDWDGNYSLDSKAAIVYNKVLYKILESIFRNKVGEEVFNDFISTHLIKRNIQNLISNDSTVWWDDLTTQGVKETRTQVIVQSFNKGIDELEDQLGEDFSTWQWADVHTLEHGHPLGSVEALRPYFNVGPFSVPGSNEVINNYLFKLNSEGEYKVTSGPSTRRLIDFSDVANNSWSILPTGQSGVPFSKHYKSQAEMYAKGQFRKQLMDEKIIRDSFSDILELLPAN